MEFDDYSQRERLNRCVAKARACQRRHFQQEVETLRAEMHDQLDAARAELMAELNEARRELS